MKVSHLIDRRVFLRTRWELAIPPFSFVITVFDPELSRPRSLLLTLFFTSPVSQG
jgi:hypothetical protein